jgi:hypothetical protein
MNTSDSEKLNDLIKGCVFRIETEANYNREFLQYQCDGEYEHGNTEQKLESLQLQIDDLTALVKVLVVQCTSSAA